MHLYNRYDSERRILDAPVMFFSLQEVGVQLKQDSEWNKHRRNAVTLVKTDSLSVVLIALQSGTSLQEHHAEGPITVSVLSGKIAFKAGDQERHVEAKGLVFLEAGLSHEVRALEESVLLVTLPRLKQPTSSAPRPAKIADLENKR